MSTKSNSRLKKVAEVKPLNDNYGLSWDVYQLTDKRKETLLKKYAEWIEKEDSLQLMVFYKENKITCDLWMDLCQKHPEFFRMHRHGKQLIGQRRENLMWHNKINAGVALRTQRMYSDDFQKMYQDDINFKDKLASKDTNVRFLPVLAPVLDTGIKPVGEIDGQEE